VEDKPVFSNANAEVEEEEKEEEKGARPRGRVGEEERGPL
jgi:hypothetical protein